LQKFQGQKKGTSAGKTRKTVFCWHSGQENVGLALGYREIASKGFPGRRQ
jgi:hypothetical protein